MSKKESSSPYKNTFFLLFVAAKFLSNTGTWLFSVASSWLMTELNSSAFMVSLVQTATLIPLFLFGLPTGAMGDIFNQKKIILISQGMLILNTLIFAYIVYLDKATVTLLLLFTFLNGVGGAFSKPILSAITPRLVQRKHLRTAVNLTSVAYNLSRAIGPILAGSLITMYALDVPFWLNAISFGAVVAVIAFWKYEEPDDDTADQKVSWAIGDAIRFLRYTPALYNSIIRALLFFFPAAALWALLPLVAKKQFGGDADLYGYFLGAAGFGAVVSVLLANRVTKIIGSGKLTTIVSVIMGVCLFFLGAAGSKYMAMFICFGAGICWQLSVVSIITSCHRALPKWFGARGMAYFIMAMSGSLAIGSALWGLFADAVGLQYGLYGAGITSAVIGIVALRFPLDMAEEEDFVTAQNIPELPISDKSDKGGRVLVQISYSIEEDLREDAIQKIKSLRNKRYCSGAMEWNLFVPSDAPSTLVETFYEVSLQQYERHRKHITKYDMERIKEINRWICDHGGTIEREYYLEADY